MWKLFLSLSLLSTSAFAAGLIQVPDAAVVKTPSAQPVTPGPGYQRATPFSTILANDGTSYAEKLPKRLDGAPQAEYEGYFRNIFEGMKKTSMQKLSVNIPVDVSKGIRCLNTNEAFGFERISDTQYRANCFAGTGKKITHVAEFRLDIQFTPPDCGTDAKITSVFSDAANRTRVGAGKFYRSIELGCTLDAVAADRMNPITKLTPISTDFVKKTLEDNAELDKYVNGSRAAPSKDSYTPPVVADEDRPAKPKKPARQVSDEGEDDAPRSRPVACSPGNPFCKSSSAD